MRDRADLVDAAAGAGLTIRQIETLPDGTITSRMVFDDPWAAARLLVTLTNQDAGDPIVRAWSLAILRATANAIGEADAGPTLSPELLAAFVRALHGNVITQIKFRHEPVETFQAARYTMQVEAGDCDDHGRLLVSLAKAAGLEARLVFIDDEGRVVILEDGEVPVDGSQPAHATSLLKDGDGWWWAETTIDAGFGEPPLDALDRLLAEGVDLGRNPFEDAGPAMRAIGSWGVVTAGDVASRKDELNTIVQSIENDVIACLTKIDAGTVYAWNAFLAEWDGFYADAPAWYNAGAQGRQAGEYTDRIHDWQQKLGSQCTLSTPTVPIDQGPSEVFSAVKVGAVALAAVAAAFVVHDVTRLLPAARR